MILKFFRYSFTEDKINLFIPIHLMARIFKIFGTLIS